MDVGVSISKTIHWTLKQHMNTCSTSSAPSPSREVRVCPRSSETSGPHTTSTMTRKKRKRKRKKGCQICDKGAAASAFLRACKAYIRCALITDPRHINCWHIISRTTPPVLQQAKLVSSTKKGITFSFRRYEAAATKAGYDCTSSTFGVSRTSSSPSRHAK